MKIRFVLYVGDNEYTTVVEFADNADEQEIEQAFCGWRAELSSYGFWEQCDE